MLQLTLHKMKDLRDYYKQLSRTIWKIQRNRCNLKVLKPSILNHKKYNFEQGLDYYKETESGIESWQP